jgi:hypothetical protein
MAGAERAANSYYEAAELGLRFLVEIATERAVWHAHSWKAGPGASRCGRRPDIDEGTFASGLQR